MGKLAVLKYVAAMFLTVQIILTIFTFVALFGGNVNPIGHSARAMLVYILPLLLLGNAVMLVYWIIRRKWLFALIPIITIACCIPYIGTLWQFRSLDKSAEGQPGIKVATYNVCAFNRETSGFIAQDILSEMRRQNVDILCIQEYNEVSGEKKNSNSYKEYFPYMAVGREDMVIYSRYPIKASKKILFENTNNSAMWADIDVKGDKIRVFNVHFQTTGINGLQWRAAKLQGQGFEVRNSKFLETIFGNYMFEMLLRAGQADLIANEKRSSEKPVILCGDFNDVPYSYVYNTVLGNMVDGFKECGSGWAQTFRGGKKAVRIDYIFHDEVLQGLSYYKSELTYSDHYPVFMKLTFNKKK